MSYSQLSPPSKKATTEKEPQPILSRSVLESSATPEAVLSAKLASMSMEERSKGFEEVHGIADVPTETPEMIEEKSDRMTHALLAAIASLDAEASLAYREAIEMSKEYVDGLKISFLRAEHGYDSERAARRMISFFQQKKELFGSEKLVREIYLEDLGVKAREALQRGLFHVFHQRDRSGRPIFYCEGVINMIYPLQSCFQVFFYIIMACMQDEMSQLRGCVCIWNSLGVDCFLNRTSSYWNLWTSMPLRQAAFHVLSDTVDSYRPSKNVLAKDLESQPLCRFRFHYGSHMDGIYQLLTFGILREAIPLRDDGSVDLSHHHKLLDTLERIEAAKRGTQKQAEHSSSSTASAEEDSTSPSHNSREDSNIKDAEGDDNNGDDDDEGEIILIPSPMDVLMGRGRRPNNRPGTLRMFHLLNETMDAYDACTRPAQKTAIAMNIIKEMKDSGCRFLREIEGGGGYVEIDDSSARAKIAHRFRDLRRNIKTGAKNESSSTAQRDRSDTYDRTKKKRTHLEEP